jgi:hypothetical protein
MLKIKDIVENLEKIEDNKDKINYLESLLEDLEDEELIEKIESLIKVLKESLENKLNVEIPVFRKAIREIDFEDLESDVEQMQRNFSKPFQRPDLIVKNNETEETNFKYGSNANYSNIKLYNSISFDYQSLQNSFDMNVVRENLIRENILNPEGQVTEVERENLNRRLSEMMPNLPEEKLFVYQSKILEDLKKDERKYIARLR